jgi:quinone-modifying oxidoreductase subunit QmoA
LPESAAAVEWAEVGLNVILLERKRFLGGRVRRSHRYFPKLCPPTCGLEINCRRIRENPRIEVHTLAEIVNVAGRRGRLRCHAPELRNRPQLADSTP